MRIVYISGSSELGGAERVLLEMLAGVRELQPTWDLIVLLPSDGPLRREISAIGAVVEVVSLPSRAAKAGDYALHLSGAIAGAPGALQYLLRLRQVLTRLRPDIVHSNGFKMHLAAAWARPAGSKLVWHLHDHVSRRSRSAALLRWSAHRCHTIIANSQSVADDATQALRSRVMPRAILNGVNLDVFAPTGAVADLDQLSGVAPAPTGALRIALVGTYARWKGHKTFLQAVAAMHLDIPIRAYIVGGPVYQTSGSQWTREQLVREAHELKVADRVAFIDFSRSPAPIFRALDIVVHASTEPEPFGLVVAEAMACGRALVAASGGGVGEMVTAGTDALVHDPGNVDDLARCICALAVDPDLRRNLGCAARRTAEARLGSRRFVSDISRTYEQMTTTRMGAEVQPVRLAAR